MKRERGLFFLVPEGRFSGGQEGDSWWDENICCSRPTQTHPSVQVKKNIKNMKQGQMNFKEIRLVLLLFCLCHPSMHPIPKPSQAPSLILKTTRKVSRKKRFSRLRTGRRRYTEKALAGNVALRQKHNIGNIRYGMWEYWKNLISY